MEASEFQIVLTTCGDAAIAQSLAQTLVSDGLAACVNILPAAQSVYPWKGQIETASEHLLLIKIDKRRYEAVERRIQALHPYELPEIIAVPIVNGLPAYLAWLENPHGAK